MERDLKYRVLQATDGSDYLVGYDGEVNVIHALSGDDQLYGGDLGDTLDGGAGNDYLCGNGGVDTYLIAKYDGWDTIYDINDNSVNVVQFTDVVATDLAATTAVRRNGSGDLILKYGTSSQLTLSHYFDGYKAEQFQFSDGVTWTWSDLKYRVLQATDGSDYLVGYDGEVNVIHALSGDDQLYGGDLGDTLDGGAGNDYLCGNGGVDTYLIAKYDGWDTIYEINDNSVNVVQFTDVVATDLAATTAVRRNSSGDLILKYGTSSQLNLSHYFDGYRAEQFQFSDGVIWTWSDLKYRVLQATEGSDYLVGYDGEANAIYGLGGNDQLYGGNLDDALDGGDGNDSLFGGAGDDALRGGIDIDILYGNDGGDTLMGEEGNDDLYGGAGNDILIGGMDSDRLYGDDGADTYVIAKDDGWDTIYDIGDNSVNVVQFADVASTDFAAATTVRHNGSDLILKYGANGQLTLLHYFEGCKAEQFQFSDGVIWTWSDIKHKVLQATEGDDYLIGYNEEGNTIAGLDGNDRLYGGSLGDILDGGNGGDTLYGGAKNDTLIGGAGDDYLYGETDSDKLIGGIGNDYLKGGAGSDIYVIAKNDGQDTIYNDDNSVNMVKFTDVASTDVTVARTSNNDLILKYGTNSQLILSNYFNLYKAEQFRFSDGITWAWSDIKYKVLQGTTNPDYLVGYDGESNTISALDGDDKLYGGTVNDTLTGGKGNDILYGNGGADTYVIAKDDGQDTIHDLINDNSVNVVQFTDVVSADLAAVMAVRRSGGDLILKYGTNDRLTLSDYFNGYKREQFQFSDGVTWTLDAIKYKVLQATEGSDYLAGYDGEVNTIYGLGGNDRLYGGNLDDILDGGDGNDSLSGGAGSDALTGEMGLDALYGDDGNDMIMGGVDSDKLYGGTGNDVLIGGMGNDYLKGDSGTDTYVIAKGDGQDTIRYINDNSVNVIQFTDMVSSDVTAVRRNGSDFIIRHGIDDQVTLVRYFDFYRMERFQFNDGITWVWNDVKYKLVQGAEGSDNLFGYDGEANTIYALGGNDQVRGGNLDDILDGGDGDDILYAGTGNDILTGGAGNDSLRGDGGADTYVIARGDGQDSISELNDGSVNVVKFTDVASTDVTAVRRNGGDLILRYGTDAQVTLSGYFGGYKAEQFQFSDGVTWTFEDIKYKVLQGSEGSDYLAGYGGENNNIYAFGGNDLLYGGDLGDTLDGGDGDDSLYGSAGSDMLLGGKGSDHFYGGDGVDTYVIAKEDGQDKIENYDRYYFSLISFATQVPSIEYHYIDPIEYIYDNSADVVLFADMASTDFAVATAARRNDGDLILRYGSSQLTLSRYFYGPRTEQFQFSDGVTWSSGEILANIKHELLQGTAGSDYMVGYDGEANRLSGFGGNDQLYGGNVGDTLSGGAGNDYLSGGNGEDTYVIAKAGGHDRIDNYGVSYSAYINDLDVVVEVFYEYDSSINVVKFTGTASTDITAIVRHHAYPDDDLILNYGVDSQLVISIYFAGPRTEQFEFSDGVIWISADIDHKLLLQGTGGDDILQGFDGETNPISGLAGDDTLYGANLRDSLNGNYGNDSLYGNGGDDLLNGGPGADLMNGGAGSDTYVVDDVGDVVAETALAGTDMVQSAVSYTLASHVEILVLTGTVAINGTGNTLNNTFYPNAGDNVLDGGAGVDKVSYQYATAAVTVSLAVVEAQATGGSGADTLLNIEDLVGSPCADTLIGNSGNNRLNGWSGDDMLMGGAGTDTLKGGPGNDTYAVDGVNDVVTENTGEGTDTILSPVTCTLAANVENLILTGMATINGTGNALVNTLAGNGAANVLEGGVGADTLAGGAGNDTYVVDDTGDVVMETAGAGTDTINSSISYSLGAGVEKLALTGTGAISGAGNALANILVGNVGNNVLDGGLGNDILKGGAGADSLQGGAGADAFVFGTTAGGADTLLDFLSGTDKLRLSDGAGGLKIGNGDHAIGGATLANAAGAFSNAAELVIVTPNIVGTITAISAAAAIGSASAAYVLGDTRLFAVDNGVDSALYLFKSAGADTLVSATELTLVGILQGTAQTALVDYAFA